MASATLEVRIAAPIERVWDVIVDYGSYPQFVPGVLACRVAGERSGAKRVEYEVDLGIRRIRYALALREERPGRVRWSLLDGELLSRSDGSWELTAEGGATLARYTVDVQIEPPALMPRFLVDRLVGELTRVQLPGILQAFKRRVEGPA